jgi:hypothetical protein
VAELKAGVGPQVGPDGEVRAATLHDVFMAHTGRSLDDDVESDEND